jgi:hypothetical protein
MQTTTVPITVLLRAATPRTVPRTALQKIHPKMRIPRIAIIKGKTKWAQLSAALFSCEKCAGQAFCI